MSINHIKPLTQSLAFLGMLGLILAGCSPAPATLTPPSVPAPTSASGAYWPTEAWRTTTPEEQGMDSQKLAQMLAAVEQQRLSLHSLLVIRHGYIVSETYFEYYQPDTRHELYSCTKSFIATLIGIAIDKGNIDRTDHRSVDFFSAQTFENLDTDKQSMTLEDLLTMRSGLDWQEGDPIYQAMYQSADWVKYVMDKPMAQPPGSQFNYCSGCSHVLSAILQQATGMNTRDFAEQNLFKPLGISNIQWDTGSAGIPIGGWGLQLTPREMAKLGYLYLREGKWEAQQIVSAQWVKTATQKHTGTDSQLGYGYQWWVYPTHGAYTALGRYGQTIFVIPESDLVVVTTAALDNHDAIFQLIEEYILPAVQKSE
jgi:CubicO group peptidase (beta-lactamase class C family)